METMTAVNAQFSEDLHRLRLGLSDLNKALDEDKINLIKTKKIQEAEIEKLRDLTSEVRIAE